MADVEEETEDRQPTFHPDGDDDNGAEDDDSTVVGADPFTNMSNEAVLHVLRYAKKFGDVNNLSADELDRRRRLQLCFNCGGPGHRSRDCNKPRPKGAGNGHGSGSGGGPSVGLHNKNNKPQQKHF